MELFLLKDGNPEAVEPAHGTYLVLESHGSRIFGRLLLPDFFDKEISGKGNLFRFFSPFPNFSDVSFAGSA